MPSPEIIRSTNALLVASRTSSFTLRVMVFGMALLSAGCVRHRTVALPPTTQAPQPTQPATIPPVEITKPAEAPPPATTTQPVTQTPPQTPPATTTPPADAPPKPDVVPKKPAPEPSRPPAPQISPQMSPGDEAELQKQTNQYVADAEKNLHHADGRDLNVIQRDMVEKIHGFLGQARDAMKTPDWTRARNLSQKAFLLSVELANSLP
jgi:outer membrane biosynthesis protein TonB